MSTIDLLRRSSIEGGKSQNLKLFIRGKAISGAPPIIIGITIKKIMIKAWAVTIVL